MILMKRVIAVHDISGVGKCSLTAALPILSAAGIECNPLPTAILSTHTGNIEGYTFTDLTDKMMPAFEHWMKLGLKFDGLYSGYLGSVEQTKIVEQMAEKLDNALIVIDPAMADSGKLYVGFDDNFVLEMKRLCKKADVLVPNITEGCLLTGKEYKEDFSLEETEELLCSLGEIAKKYVVLTGTSSDKNSTGVSVFEKATGIIKHYSSPKYPGTYYGTGDIFASVLTAGLMKGKNCFDAAKKAMNFTASAIKETYEAGTDPRFGVAFEEFLAEFSA